MTRAVGPVLPLSRLGTPARQQSRRIYDAIVKLRKAEHTVFVGSEDGSVHLVDGSRITTDELLKMAGKL